MRRHDTDVTSLVFGVIFAGVALVWALVETDVVKLDNLTVLGPAVLVVAGLIGLVASLRGSRPRDDGGRDDREPEPAYQGYGSPAGDAPRDSDEHHGDPDSDSRH